MEVLLRSPPETPFLCTSPTLVFWHYSSLRAYKRLETRASIWSELSWVLILLAKTKSSLGVIVSTRISSCYTNAPKRQNCSLVSGIPFASISPVSCNFLKRFPGPKPGPSLNRKLLLPDNRLSSVVLPQPDGPINATISPGLTMPLTSYITFFSPISNLTFYHVSLIRCSLSIGF